MRWQGASLPDAADCVQEALVLAFQSWSSLEQPYAWCRTVATRLYMRRVADVEQPTDDLEVGTPLLAESADLDAFEKRLTLLRVLDRLPHRQRQIVALTYDGATPVEIAADLQMKPETVRSSLRTAREKLRAAMRSTESDAT
jgi:RNA polymerase sigma-70 factor (ECF subfamily)